MINCRGTTPTLRASGWLELRGGDGRLRIDGRNGEVGHGDIGGDDGSHSNSMLFL